MVKIFIAFILLALAVGCAPALVSPTPTPEALTSTPTEISTPTPQPQTPTQETPTPSPTEVSTPTPTPLTVTPTPKNLLLLPSLADVVAKVRPTVVYISVEYESTGFFRTTTATKTGSGAIMSPEGYILTNNHVVEDALNIEVFLPDGEESYEARIVGTDPLGDLAVIKIDGWDFPNAEFGEAPGLRIGDWVIALGNALGLEGGPSVTLGIVSNLERSFVIGESTYYDVIQTDAAINPGNSGGPLVNLEGKVVGINTFIISGAENIGFAVSTNTARRVYEELISHGRVTRPYLGASFQTVTPPVAAELDLLRNRGVVIASIDSDGPVAREGLRVNDIISRFEDQEVTEATKLIKLLWQYEVGDRVRITFWRGDEEQEIWVTLGERPEGL